MKPRVLMVAYACDPEGTGEHWLGWGWAEQAARRYEVHVLTSPNARESLARHATQHGITIHHVDLPSTLRRLTLPFGRFGGWLRKMLWAYAAAGYAEAQHQRTPFAIVHQTTFHTFRIPFLASRLGIPSVWGPLAGGEHIPFGYYEFIGPLLVPESMRRVFNGLWLRLPIVQETLRQTNVIFASNKTTRDYLGPILAAKTVVVPPNAIRAGTEKAPVFRVRSDQSFRLLYVGNCLATRAMPLVFAALARAKLSDTSLAIVGGGSGLPFWKKQARKYGVADQVKFVGPVPHQQLTQYYSEADVLVFPALRDSGGSALLEAMSLGLPVICLDWAGPAEMVDENCGIKVPILSPRETIEKFAEALITLHHQPELRLRLGRQAAERTRQTFTWERKRQILEATYDRLLTNSPASASSTARAQDL